MNKGLDFLREKYGAAKGTITLKDGHCYIGSTPLILGRMERKIIELKKMTENGTLEGVSTLRFASFGPKGSDLEAMLAKEFAVAAKHGGGDRFDAIARTHADTTASRARPATGRLTSAATRQVATASSCSCASLGPACEAARRCAIISGL